MRVVLVSAEGATFGLSEDGSLSMQNVQSIMPGATGLYYYRDGVKCLLNTDNNGRVVPPEAEEWEDCTYYTSFGPMSPLDSERELAKKDGEIGALRQRIGDLMGEVNQVNQWHNDSKWRIGQLEALVSGKDNEMERLRGEGGGLRERIGQLTGELNQEKQWHNGAKSRIVELEAMLNAMHHGARVEPTQSSQADEGTVQKLEQELQETREQRDDFGRQLEDMRRSYEQAKWRVVELEAKESDKQDELDALRERISNLLQGEILQKITQKPILEEEKTSIATTSADEDHWEKIDEPPKEESPIVVAPRPIDEPPRKQVSPVVVAPRHVSFPKKSTEKKPSTDLADFGY
jgi:hypothetical protein